MTPQPVDICVIEDDAAQRNAIVGQLQSCGHSVVAAGSGEAGMKLIYQHRPCVILCDINLPDVSGFELCRRIRGDCSLDSAYVVLITAYDSDEYRRTAFQAGADDYVRKPFDLELLKTRIRSGLRFHRLQERLRHAASADGLTGLWNHAHFTELLDREFLRTRRYGGCTALLMIDLDYFKAINDTFGHEIGNAVLKLTARHIERCVRETDLVARYGGEEFAVICPQTTLEEAELLAERIRKTLPQAAQIAEQPQLTVRTSIGVASTEDPRIHNTQDLVNLADQALYCSKRAGRNRVTTSTGSLSVGDAPELQVDEIDRLRKEIVSLTMQIKELCLRSVWALIQALEARDGYSAWHSRNVTLYTKWLVDETGWSRPMRIVTANAAMLHDLGKIGVPDALLLKPQSLDPQEASLLRQVPLITCRILEPLRVFDTEIATIRHLRERYDGAGYPDGLVGESIPIGSRLLAVAEAFDSMTCNRAFRMGRSKEAAVELIRAEAGKQFDPEFAALLGRSVRKHPARWQNQIDRARVQMSSDAFSEMLEL
ncbi:MAG: diguanylate cyclase [Planctomycetes bacterium]|nr:diguanylate cyclase [Planctomycetota bacterium]